MIAVTSERAVIVARCLLAFQAQLRSIEDVLTPRRGLVRAAYASRRRTQSVHPLVLVPMRRAYWGEHGNGALARDLPLPTH